MTWGGSTGNVTAYEVLESLAFGGESLVYSGTNQTLSRSGMADGVYWYRLRACNLTACSAYWSLSSEAGQPRGWAGAPATIQECGGAGVHR